MVEIFTEWRIQDRRNNLEKNLSFAEPIGMENDHIS